ncbi:MAG TPA: UDP-N-acetylmuramoyl-L-alanyl-D-glutamate--2,6-diaminopimelate ligase [Acidimicrobiales bacterium]|nr:UDP-N-acetylmuramoyl-L-alanyl-D-glutamate--2,6-diaminopimelate ligase [Acidimicrobiales bacterium]
MDRLLEAVDLIAVTGDPSRAEVTSVALDSRRVEPGALFCCLPGHHADGHDFAHRALSGGAVGLLVERHLPGIEAPQAVVAPGMARRAMAQVSKALYHDPASALTTVGVTGTNGKTTVTHLLAAIFEAHGIPCAVIGTLDGARTTPEAPDLQRLLAEARDGGRAAVSMEVSSHALTEARVDGIVFTAAVFTNLSHDHLDHHGTMEAYFEAKAELFTPQRTALGVVNAEDTWGQKLIDWSTVPIVVYGESDASAVQSLPTGTSFTWRGRRVGLRLSGRYHVVNAVAAATTASALGVPDDAVVAGLEAAAPVPGRFEVVAPGGPFTVVVDYAHTPEGLRSALRSARQLAGTGRVVCMFGCGGERDRAKRPAMGAVAAADADVVVITSDNPRGEEPRSIIDDILTGAHGSAEVVVELERRAAIGRALDLARGGDVVLLAGKGHEQAIEAGGRFLPFDDRVEAAAALAERGQGASEP